MDKFESIGSGVKQFITHYTKKLSYHTNFILNKPILALLMVTSSCNLRCKQCISWNYKKKKELTTKEWKKVIFDLKELHPFFLSITGGEPLLRKDAPLLIKTASQNGFRVGLNTNGTLLNKKKSQELADSGLNILMVSLDSLNPSVHDYYRGIRGTCKKTISNVLYLNENYKKPRIQVSTILLKENLNEIPSLIRWIKENNIYGIRFNVPLPDIWDSKIRKERTWFKKSRIWFKNDKKINETINEIIQLKKEGYSVLNPISQLKLMKNYFASPEKKLPSINCKVGVSNVRIAPWGGVKFCNRLEEVGNVKTQSMKSMWYSKKAQQVRKKIKDCKNTCVLSNCNFDESILTKAYNFMKYQS